MRIINKIPYKCPICDGVGMVSGGFYNRVNTNDWGSTTISEQCRQCNGSGIVYGEQIIESDNPELLNQ